MNLTVKLAEDEKEALGVVSVDDLPAALGRGCKLVADIKFDFENPGMQPIRAYIVRRPAKGTP